jgi:hypothetical protein
VRELAEPEGWNSAIVPDFPKLFEDFKQKKFTLLWRGTRDCFGARDFPSRCDRHSNTLTVIVDTDAKVFGGFMPLTESLISEVRSVSQQQFKRV